MALSSSIFGGTDAIAKTEPGGTLLLPGVTIPFFEGVLAIVIIMAVHEGAHAILARIGRIKVLSSGIVLFGIIPVGAFVEPDEKQLEKMEKTKQTRVLVAGSSSNLIVSIIAFVLFAMLAITANKFSLMSVSYLAPIIKFLYITLGLTYTLNFVVGTINLLPLPFFDGYRIIDANLENRVIVRGLMYLTLAAFIMNFIPWLFKP
jgi:membrane-associated protease RseP (regulator of RpoE activity)